MVMSNEKDYPWSADNLPTPAEIEKVLYGAGFRWEVPEIAQRILIAIWRKAERGDLRPFGVGFITHGYKLHSVNLTRANLGTSQKYGYDLVLSSDLDQGASQEYNELSDEPHDPWDDNDTFKVLEDGRPDDRVDRLMHAASRMNTDDYQLVLRHYSGESIADLAFERGVRPDQLSSLLEELRAELQYQQATYYW